MPLLTKTAAKAALADLARLNVRPGLIELYAFPPAYRAGKRWRKKRLIGPLLSLPLRAWGNLFAPPGNWDLATSHFSDHLTYRRMRDLKENMADFRSSDWYKLAAQELQRTGAFRYKQRFMRSVAELDAFFADYLVGMLTSMQRSGYVHTTGGDCPGVMIGRHGELIKSPGGRHRWAAATLLELPAVPVEIEHIHPLWLKRIGGGFSGASLQRLQQSLRDLQVRYTT